MHLRASFLYPIFRQYWSKIMTHIINGSNNLTSSALLELSLPLPRSMLCLRLGRHARLSPTLIGGKGDFQTKISPFISHNSHKSGNGRCASYIFDQDCRFNEMGKITNSYGTKLTLQLWRH